MTTTNDTRTPAERKYDMERDGSLYFRQSAEDTDAIIAILSDLYGDEDDPTVDQPLTDDERVILDWIVAHAPRTAEDE